MAWWPIASHGRAPHPQTLMALTYDGQKELPPRYGFPMKLRMPTKLGYREAS